MREPEAERVRRAVAEPVVIADYDEAWPAAFEQEKRRLLSLVPPGIIVRVEHFGSTAVPGLAAKPVIDVLVEVRDLAEVRDRVAPLLERHGYEYFWRPTAGDDTPPYYAWFIRRDEATGQRTHHIHMVEAGFAEHWERLLFRDYLIAHPDTARRYESVKRQAARQHPTDRTAYTAAKSEFIAQIMPLARAERGYGSIR